MSFQWHTQNNTQQKTNKLWIVGLVVAGLACLIISFWQKNFILAILTILILFVIFQFNRKDNSTHIFSVSDQGIQINKKLYLYQFLKSFWIFYEPNGIQELSIESKKTIVPLVKIPLYNQDPNEIRKFLLRYLPEKEQEESLIDIIAHRLGF
ncbi:MAG: hypothetical protein COY09_00290 [Candidatus Portnoybacteria bacterium CG_4_10_14_0_2_um_filter_39_11]|uniref:DUF5673 domain-containing protein n=1 Tax=Candidatus Portnoybacteria bacterium CG_4_10_14_0_2_um_filter_39_11 TaxID=1974797 RepID=A0A2M7UKH3_9BACT|nr:MAG: hypothetical protein AUJ33_02085 [Parcubacteria group bacterium CG1_02_40_25]PIZ71652.1 MAG: hypothetical protein COY09_00290 [Candidatus Portnoybacteria bacterium CG_4_10_14_0_2_um_filter_39_11]